MSEAAELVVCVAIPSFRAELLAALFRGMSILDSLSYEEFLKNFRWLVLLIVNSCATVLVMISFNNSNSIVACDL